MLQEIGRTGIEHDVVLVALAAFFALACAGVVALIARAHRHRSEVMSRRLKLIAETASDLILIADHATDKIIWANNAFASEVKVPLADIVGRTDKELGIEMISISPTEEEIGERLGRGETVPCRVVAKNPRGLKHWEGTIRVVMDADSGVSHRVTTFYDVTERVLAEQRLRESEERFQLAVQGSNDGIWDWQINGDVLFTSPRAHELLGFDPAERHLNSMADLRDRLHPEDRDRVVAAMMAHLGQGVPYRIDNRVRCTDGGYRWFRTRGQAVWNDDGVPVRMVGFVSDIDDLIRATKEAEIASRLKSQFLANMSHEIRTPMNGVMGMMQLLQKTSLNDKQERFVAMALSSSRALLTIINDILDLSRIESGLMTLNPETFDMGALVDDALGRVEGVAAHKNIKIHRSIAASRQGAFAGDAPRIIQIIVNLLGNAIKFTERGEVALEITPGEVGSTRFSVRDTGPGIPAEQSAIVFERFRQIDGSSTRKHGGTGLGLAISKELVELMKGKMGLDSVVGVGSTFWFEIPLPFETIARADSGRASGETNDADAATRGLRVLVAEDNPMNQRVIAETADSVGMNVRIVGNGREAIAALEEESFDLVLMDIQMPEMTGDVAIQTIRSGCSRYAAIPIIVVTADVMKGSVERYAAAGADGLLPKPIEIDEMIRTIRAVMDKRTKRAAA